MRTRFQNRVPLICNNLIISFNESRLERCYIMDDIFGYLYQHIANVTFKIGSLSTNDQSSAILTTSDCFIWLNVCLYLCHHLTAIGYSLRKNDLNEKCCVEFVTHISMFLSLKDNILQYALSENTKEMEILFNQLRCSENRISFKDIYNAVPKRIKTFRETIQVTHFMIFIKKLGYSRLRIFSNFK